MSVITQVRALPRGVVGAGLGLARLPVTVAARAAGQQSNDKWAPTLAFEGLEAGVETVLGSLLRDETLVSRGRVRQAKVSEVRRAVELETLAEQQRHQADETLTERREQAQRQRDAADQAAATRERQLAQQAQRQKQAVEQKAAQKTAAAGRVEAAQEETLERKERAAAADAVDKETEALRAEKQALEAEETVAVIDDSIEGTKAARETDEEKSAVSR